MTAQYGKEPIIGGETSVLVTLKGGRQAVLNRIGGMWHSPLLKRPIKHLRDAQRAIRGNTSDAGTCAVCQRRATRGQAST